MDHRARSSALSVHISCKTPRLKDLMPRPKSGKKDVKEGEVSYYLILERGLHPVGPH